MSLGYFFSRLSIIASKTLSWSHGTRNIVTTSTRSISATPCLHAEPLKKKKRLDPQILKQREDRKRRKLEKSIRQMQKFTMPLKPIDELLVPLSLQDEKEKRRRALPVSNMDEQEQRILLLKSWCRYRLKEHVADIQMLDRIMYSQQHALDELRQESEELYQAALQIDENLVPFELKGPVLTPPIENYDSPDGDYHNVSYKWE